MAGGGEEEEEQVAFMEDFCLDVQDPLTRDILKHVELSGDESVAEKLLLAMKPLIDECIEHLAVHGFAELFQVTSSVSIMRAHIKDMGGAGGGGGGGGEDEDEDVQEIFDSDMDIYM